MAEQQNVQQDARSPQWPHWPVHCTDLKEPHVMANGRIAGYIWREVSRGDVILIDGTGALLWYVKVLGMKRDKKHGVLIQGAYYETPQTFRERKWTGDFDEDNEIFSTNEITEFPAKRFRGKAVILDEDYHHFTKIPLKHTILKWCESKIYKKSV
eukprot:gene5658-6844_t